MTTDATPATARRRRHLAMGYSWAMGAVWLIYLIYPVIAVVRANLGIPAKVTCLVLIAIFAAIYVYACAQIMAAPDYYNRRVWVAAALLIVVIAVSAIFLDEGALALVPFLLSVSGLGLPLWPAALIFVAVFVATLVAPQLISAMDVDPTLSASIVIVALVIAWVRFLRDRARVGERLAAAEHQIDERAQLVAERERVARDVHDILGHSLTVISLKSELAGRLVDLDPERAKAELAELNTLSRQALREIRQTVGGLRQVDLDAELLAAQSALRAAQIDCDIPDAAVVADAKRRELFAWVLRESVTNVVRHSGARHCSIVLTPTSIHVADNGRGIRGAVGNGLTGLRERVLAAGGELTVTSGNAGSSGDAGGSTGSGATVTVTLR